MRLTTGLTVEGTFFEFGLVGIVGAFVAARRKRSESSS
jgi:hypothetical protein